MKKLRLSLPNLRKIFNIVKFRRAYILERSLVKQPKEHLLVITKKNSDPNHNYTGAPNDNFRENICSEDDLRSRIFGTFVVKFLVCLPLLGFSNMIILMRRVLGERVYNLI